MWKSSPPREVIKTEYTKFYFILVADVKERDFSSFLIEEEVKEEFQHQISGYGSSSSSLHFPKILNGLLKIQIIDTGIYFLNDKRINRNWNCKGKH
jgi:hypothetical protein